ncbi:MAG: hypothetical protein JW709_10710 [Sedimentisphaerales bacterium]|nr:hypothetical protein [Sedimentisphaerales bacterium]
MKRQIFIFFSLFLISTAWGDTWIDLYETDGVTPYNGHPIMVGQSLVVIVASDEGEYGAGAIVLEGNDSNLGELICRYPEDCEDSALPAAGEEWFLYPEVQLGVGYNFCTGDEPIAGNWFVFDYTATDVGDPNIALYMALPPGPDPTLVYRTEYITQVPTRDFDEDGGVNLGDLAIIAEHWLSSSCSAPDWCEQADLNQDTYVNVLDLAAFTEFWLELTG